MCKLGLSYYHGRGVLKDPFKAKCWIKQAHDLGAERAEKIWNSLELWQYSGNCDLGFDLPVQAGARQKKNYIEPVTGMEFVWIPGKCFKMGCRDQDSHGCDRGESPVHKVCLDGFWMGKYEVTQEQWISLMDVNPSRFKGDRLPVEQVSYTACWEFIQRLNRETGLGFSLPSEAQWEFACTSRGKKSSYAWGRDGFQPRANCGGCNSGSFRGRTAPVGSFSPNRAGLYDMGGNVREWCRDIYDRDAYKNKAHGKKAYKRGDLDDENKDRGQSHTPRVVRGGSFVDPVSSSCCRARQSALPGIHTYFMGFRLVVDRVD
ncbi:MAG: SUMF1/EgtB/PvdO family nonheme iron enzyme [Desulfobacter sp.]|nr:SUMF1/EgtB/PvdO family nonheme iron enzyme [Desulfobacter sp.]